MATRFFRVVPGGALALLCTRLLVGCVGDNAADLTAPAVLTCGNGTVQVGGQCVPVEAGSGSGGGSGHSGAGGAGPAGAGGCAAAGGTGECGGSAGASGLGGAAGVAAEDGGSDAEPPESGVDVADAGQDGVPGPDDDPCPTEPIALNCSDSCGPKDTALCEQIACGQMYPLSIDATGGKVIIRTPSKPGINQKCWDKCTNEGETPYPFGFNVRLTSPSSTTHAYRTLIPMPWQINCGSAGGVHFLAYCSSIIHPLPYCEIWKSVVDANLLIVTENPDAPARNIVVERLPQPVTCP